MNRKKILYGLLAAAVCGIAAVLYHELLALLGTAGASLAFAAGAFASPEETVSGTVTTVKHVGEDGTVEGHDIDKPSISKKICKINPSLFPMDTMLRELQTVACNSFEHQYYSVRGRGVESKVKTAYIPVTGSESGPQQIDVTNAYIYSTDSNVLFPTIQVDNRTRTASAVEGASLNPLVCHIVAVDNIAQGRITLCPVNAAALPALAADTPMRRMGVAKHENAGMSDDPSQMPYSDSNFAQIHMTTVSEGLYQKLSDKHVQFGLLDMREQAMRDFRMTNEADALFGVKARFIDPVTRKVKYMSDGLLRKVEKCLDTGDRSTITNDMLYGWASDIFRGNNGSPRRIGFYGSDFGRKLAAAPTVQKQLEAGKTEVVFGVTFHRIETTDGILLLKPHDLLNEYGYSHALIVVDPANVYRFVQKQLEATALDRDKVGLSRSTDIRLDESHGLAVTNPDTHAVITVS